MLENELTYTKRVQDYTGFAGSSKMKFERLKLYKHDTKTNTLYTLRGFLSRVRNVFNKFGIQSTYKDLDEPSPLLVPNYNNIRLLLEEYSLREGQDVIVASIIAKDIGTIVAPTAFGKTFIQRVVCQLYPKAWIIISTPGRQLVSNTTRRLIAAGLDVGQVGGGKNDPRRISVCTHSSIMKAPVDKCNILILDECHKIAAPKLSANIASINAPQKVFGLTATPKGRSDGAEPVIEALAGPVITEIKYQDAESKNYVAKMQVHLAGVDSSKCKLCSATMSTKIVKKRKCIWRNNVRNKALYECVNKCMDLECIRDDPQILILVDTFDHAIFLKHYFFNDYTLVYSSLNKRSSQKYIRWGMLDEDFKPLSDSEKETMLQDFENDKLKRVIATGTWGTGVDFTYLDIVCIASAPSGEINSIQWTGRGTRVNKNKKLGIVVDSSDMWDPWMRSRALNRIKFYKERNWEIVTHD